MDIRQRINDLILRLKKDRTTQVIVLVGVAAALFLFFYDDGPRKKGTRRPASEISDRGAGGHGTDEAYNDLITRFDQDLKSNAKALAQLDETNKKITSKMDEYEHRTADIFKSILERMNDIEASGGQGGMGASGDRTSPINLSGPDQIVDVDGASGGLDTFGDTAIPEPAPPLPAAPVKISYVGVGDSVRVKLIAGVDAPTDGTPYPTLFKCIDDVNGPDGTQLPLGECRMVAACQGSLTDSRAICRLVNLSIRLPDGSRQDHKVDGWIVGEDGIRGMEGIPIDPLGKIIGASVISGTVRGIGEGIAASNSTSELLPTGVFATAIDGDVAEYAVGKGLSSAARSWDGIIRDRADDLIPHIRVFSGREATAIFAKSLTIQGLLDQLDEEDGVFASLD